MVQCGDWHCTGWRLPFFYPVSGVRYGGVGKSQPAEVHRWPQTRLGRDNQPQRIYAVARDKRRVERRPLWRMWCWIIQAASHQNDKLPTGARMTVCWLPGSSPAILIYAITAAGFPDLQVAGVIVNPQPAQIRFLPDHLKAMTAGMSRNKRHAALQHAISTARRG